MITHYNFEERWDSDYERALALHDVLEVQATGGEVDEQEYQYLRSHFYGDSYLRGFLPDFVTRCRTLSQFWTYIKSNFKTYAERRTYLRDEFSPLLNSLEIDERTPLDNLVSDGLESFDSENVQRRWQLALDRRESDPEGAITAARTLLETVCKYILDKRGVEYNDNNIELAQLYKAATKELNLAPEQHQEEIFKQILGGCSNVVHGLGSLRNRLGDAHGKGERRVKPSARHAKLAVNLSGAMALFLVETFEYCSPNNKHVGDS